MEPSSAAGTLTQVVALTGGIGSGKSAVAALFESWGASVVDADMLARDVVALQSKGLAEVVTLFGPEVLNLDGSLNRKALGAIVFDDSQKRVALEEILHPLIRTEWLNRLSELKRNTPIKIILYVVPLFFESGASYPEIGKVVLVTAPEVLRIKRIMSRDGCSAEEAQSRIRAQLSDDDKIPQSTFVISNDSTEIELAARARAVFDMLLQTS
jgi:dephospho-CoA kinase